nr:vitellogenin [Danio rerio]XP_021330153.1 vitellogenin [Danio rerio]|eukprot:XP_021325376.1 vitellogenin [Danio rerio]
MKTLVTALTIALVAFFDISTSQQMHLVPHLAGPQTYVYRYEALLFSGLHQKDLARAGIKINSKVLIIAADDNIFLLKLSNPQLFEYSGIWPEDTFVTSKFTLELAAQLQIPIKFEYTNGMVGKLFIPSLVPTIVINLYRGILNIFQLNLKKTQNVYEIQEDGIQGICKTQYVISEDEENNHTTIIKSKDLTSCHKRIMKDVGLSYLEKCIECQQKIKSYSGAVTYSYILKPAPNGVMITEATVREIHQFTPQYEIGDATQMETRQTLTFLEIMTTDIIPISADYLARGTLQYEFSTETLWSPIQLMKISDAQAQIVDALNNLATKKKEVHEDVPLKYIHLIQLMRFASVDAVEGIWSQFKTRPNFRKWILDAIPAVGTLAALKFIKKTFLAGELSFSEFTQVLLVAVHMVTANLDTIKMYSSLALHHKVQETPVLREIAMLGYGTMIARYCSGALECPVELLKHIHEIATKVSAKADIAEITLILKVLGNAAHPASIKYITKFLPIFGTHIHQFPMRVQVDAILTLKALAKKESKQVLNVVLQLFLNKDLHPELRMLSWIVIFETKPSMGLVITLARGLRSEKNLQVSSFAYSHMKALARSTAPDFALIAIACNVAIKILSPKLDKLSFLYSKAFLLDGYTYPLMDGAAASAFFINDATTILPRVVVAKVHAYLAGAAADVFEVSSSGDTILLYVGIRTDGIQEVLLKSPFLNEDGQPTIRQLFQALKSFKTLSKKQHIGSIYIKLFGQEIAFANVDKAVLEQAIQFTTEGHMVELIEEALKKMQNGIVFQYAKPLLMGEVRHIFPSAAGVPMELSLYAAAVVAGNLNVQAIITPPLTELTSVAHLMKTDVKVTAEISPSIALQAFAVAGINTGFIQAASIARGKIHTLMPLKVVGKFDITHANFKLQTFPIAFPVHAVTAQYVTVHSCLHHFTTVYLINNILCFLFNSSFETLSAAGNIEDVNAQIIKPTLPKMVVVQSSQNTLTSIISPGALSSEPVMPPVKDPELRSIVPVHKTLCSVIPHIGIKTCMEVLSCNAAFIKNTTLYNMIGQHGGLELEVQLGARAAKKLLKEINNVYLKTPKIKTILQKLREILEGRKRDKSSRFFNHKKIQIAPSSSRRSFSSSSSVHDSISHLSETRSLVDSVPPVVAIIGRVVRVDHKLLGYQLTAYVDRPNSRVQMIVVSIAAKDNWKMCADAVLMSKQTIVAKMAWGAESPKYAITIKGGTGHHGPSPMVYLKVKCEKVPRFITAYSKSVAGYIPGAAEMTGLTISNEKNIERQIELIILVQDLRTLDIIIKTPLMTLSKTNLVLPIALPFEAYPEDNVIKMIQNLYKEASSAKCSKVRSILTTFNHRTYNCEIPLSFYQVLVQDCTSEHKFLILMKKDDVYKHEVLSIKVADIAVQLYQQDSVIKVRINGTEVTTDKIPYHHPTGTIHIEKKGAGIAFYAPGHGLNEVYYAADQWEIYVGDRMKGQTRGICEKADGEIKQEYRRPYENLTKSSVGFAHSWVLPAESCHDADQCHTKLETMTLRKQRSDWQASKCSPTQPVVSFIED